MSISLRKAPNARQIESICNAAEKAARDSLFGKVHPKRLEDLNIAVEAKGSKPLSLSVEVSIDVLEGDYDMKTLAREVTDAAFSAAEKKVMELGLCRKPRS